MAGRRREQGTISGAKLRPRHLATQNLELVAQDQQLDVLDVQATATPNQCSEQRPERDVEKREGHGRDPPNPPAKGATRVLAPFTPGTGKTHLATALGIKACVAGHRVQFASATTWVTRLAAAQREHRLDTYLRILERYPLLIVDEVGYLPFDAEAANLFFQLVGARYERGSLIVTSNKPFTAWGEIFGDPVVAAAMIDRLVHHAEIINMKGESYRLKDRLAPLEEPRQKWGASSFSRSAYHLPIIAIPRFWSRL